MGAKVIFYCLKEVYRQLCLSDMSPSTSSDDLRQAAADDDDLQSGEVSTCYSVESGGSPVTRPNCATPPVAGENSKSRYFNFFRRKDEDASGPSLIDAMHGKGLIQDVVLLGCPINAKVVSLT